MLRLKGGQLPPLTFNQNHIMAFAPHQQRVVDEKARLDENIPKLSAFIEEGEIFPTLDGAEQERMRTQLSLMGQLSVVLGERIDNFPQP